MSDTTPDTKQLTWPMTAEMVRRRPPFRACQERFGGLLLINVQRKNNGTDLASIVVSHQKPNVERPGRQVQLLP